MTPTFRHTLLLSCIFICSLTVQAQSPWLNNNKPGFLTFEFMKPNMQGGNDGISFFSAVYALSGGISLGEKSEIIFDLPISHIKSERQFSSESETGIGNTYLAIRSGDRAKAVRWELGTLLPTSNEYKYSSALFGWFAMPNMNEKFSANTWALSAKMIAEKILNDEKGLYYRVRGGLMYAKDSEFDVSGILLDVVSQVGIRTEEGVGLFGGVSYRINVWDDVESNGDDDKTSFIFAMGASYRAKNFEPGVTINLPLDDPFKEFVSNVIGVSFIYHLDE